ncbi:hypothetical protein C8R43DRAFT_950056 [Mycena crocata]|nr:hypothetical protein C8R43DRAFT_950056 [Mycena crocata]
MALILLLICLFLLFLSLTAVCKTVYGFDAVVLLRFRLPVFVAASVLLHLNVINPNSRAQRLRGLLHTLSRMRGIILCWFHGEKCEIDDVKVEQKGLTVKQSHSATCHGFPPTAYYNFCVNPPWAILEAVLGKYGSLEPGSSRYSANGSSGDSTARTDSLPRIIPIGSIPERDSSWIEWLDSSQRSPRGIGTIQKPMDMVGQVKDPNLN